MINMRPLAPPVLSNLERVTARENEIRQMLREMFAK
jgi:hypothetical protein